MKNYYSIILLFFCFFINITFSQNINGRVIDSLTNEPLNYVNITYINKNIGVNTNELGFYSLKLIDLTEKLLISHIGYEKKIIDLKKFDISKENILDIRLIPKIEVLNEIVITSKKKEYSKIKKIGTSKNIKVKTGFPFGYEFSNLIKNPFNKKGKLISVILNINKRENFDFLSSYNFRFYEYDSINKCPGKEIYFENLVVEPENKTYKLKVDVKNLNIDYPKNGLCIGIQIINAKYENKIESMSRIAPYINFTQTGNEILTWTRYRDKNWTIGTTKSQVSKKHINSMINIEVKLEK